MGDCIRSRSLDGKNCIKSDSGAAETSEKQMMKDEKVHNITKMLHEECKNARKGKNIRMFGSCEIRMEQWPF